MTHVLLLPFSRACFRVIKAGGILVPDPATLQRGQRCDHAGLAEETPPCMFIHTRMHANSDTEMVTHIHGLHNCEIRLTSMNIVFKKL